MRRKEVESIGYLTLFWVWTRNPEIPVALLQDAQERDLNAIDLPKWVLEFAVQRAAEPAPAHVDPKAAPTEREVERRMAFILAGSGVSQAGIIDRLAKHRGLPYTENQKAALRRRLTRWNARYRKATGIDPRGDTLRDIYLAYVFREATKYVLGDAEEIDPNVAQEYYKAVLALDVRELVKKVDECARYRQSERRKMTGAAT